MRKFPLFLFVVMTTGLIACSPMAKLAKAQTSLLQDTALKGAHLGVAVYDPATSKYLYNYQGDHYFVPASNTKLFTCYAAMKYLGDSLVGARYEVKNSELYIVPGGDPTFLHPDYKFQPLIKLFRGKEDLIYVSTRENVKKYGPGWSWDDYEADYMPERSSFPIFGNVIWLNEKPTFTYSIQDTAIEEKTPIGNSEKSIYVTPRYFMKKIGSETNNDQFTFRRPQETNDFYTLKSSNHFIQQAIPFITDNNQTAFEILESVLHKKVTDGHLYYSIEELNSMNILHSQPTDSLLRPMMHRSDNFFAEQSLLMVSNEKLGYMNDEAIIDTLLQNDLKDLPQKPVWVDGSGLSRYNLITPQDFVTVLLKMKNEFGIDRIKNILPKGNTGTLTNYYQKLGANIFAKTGSLSGVIALSGYLTCKSGKLLLFSVIVNNHNSSGRAVRRAVEKFVTEVWEKN